MQDLQAIIASLNLEPHPEGGFYKEMHRSSAIVEAFAGSGKKSAYTSIHYLLSGKDFSAWHRIKSDETWYFHLGCDAFIYFFDENKTLQTIQLGMGSKILQTTIPAHTWFAAKPMSEDSFCLVSCAVAPGFEFIDFEIGQRQALAQEFGLSANNLQIIDALTRV
jgi:hypothetical protein